MLYCAIICFLVLYLDVLYCIVLCFFLYYVVLCCIVRSGHRSTAKERRTRSRTHFQKGTALPLLLLTKSSAALLAAPLLF